jgi:hypothetical protein
MGLDWVCSSMVGHLLCIIVKKKKSHWPHSPQKKKKAGVSVSPETVNQNPQVTTDDSAYSSLRNYESQNSFDHFG